MSATSTRKLSERRRVRRREISARVPEALKRDLKKIAEAENRSLAQIVSGMCRLGIARYFELAGIGEAPELLRAKLEDVYETLFENTNGPDTPVPGMNKTPGKNVRLFDAAMEEGRAYFESLQKKGVA